MRTVMAAAGLTCAMLGCLGCSDRQVRIIEPTYSYLSDSSPVNRRAIWPVRPTGVATLAEARTRVRSGSE